MATAKFTCVTSSSPLCNLKSRANCTFECLNLSSFRLGCQRFPSSLPLSVHFPHSSQKRGSFTVAFSSSSLSSLCLKPTDKNRFPSFFAVFQEQEAEMSDVAEQVGDTDSEEGLAAKSLFSKLYVCNFPRSYDIPELLDIFKQFGTVLAVEVSRNTDTGESRGCGFVTMCSNEEAKAAIVALDGHDVCGREMRVRFSVEMTKGRSNLEALNLGTRRILLYESPYKVYVGNLAWSIKPADLRYLFSQFGTVVSATVVHNHSAGRRRNYGFLSFSSASERNAAFSLNGTELCGRNLIVREVFAKEKP